MENKYKRQNAKMLNAERRTQMEERVCQVDGISFNDQHS
jgi:hypothetical protein